MFVKQVEFYSEHPERIGTCFIQHVRKFIMSTQTQYTLATHSLYTLTFTHTLSMHSLHTQHTTHYTLTIHTHAHTLTIHKHTVTLQVYNTHTIHTYAFFIIPHKT